MFVYSDLTFWLYAGVVLLIAAAATLSIVWLVWRAAKLIFFQMPRQILQGNSPRNLFSVAVALLVLPRLLVYLFAVSSNLLQLPLAIVQSLGGLAKGWPPQPGVDYGANLVISVFTTIMKRLVDSLALTSAPYDQLPLFVVLLFAVSWLFDRVSAYSAGAAQAAQQPRLYEHPQVVNVAFIMIVVVSLYLCLAALLAVPLMEKEEVADGFAVTDLAGHLQSLEPKRADFQGQYPDVSIVDVKTDAGPWPAGLLAGLRVDQASLKQTVNAWNGTREIVFIRIVSLRTNGLENFRAQNAEGFGGREAVRHYAAMLEWYDRERTELETGLADCFTRARAVISDVSSAFNQTQSQPPADLDLTPLLNLRVSIDAARSTCESAKTKAISSIPSRPKRIDDLLLVGQATAWLIGPESMPLIIIVGLVGFSFLGASVSRIVRVGAGTGIRGLSLTDVLQIVIGGATAALVVFLASYGGLAVLGDTSIDPNPYVVFVLCLIGAMFSEDVWTWARQRILGQALNGPPANGNNPPPP
jgi:hypothetical protein